MASEERGLIVIFCLFLIAAGCTTLGDGFNTAGALTACIAALLMIMVIRWMISGFLRRRRGPLAVAARSDDMPAARQAEEDGPDDCPICLGPVRKGDVMRTLRCGHRFHLICIDRWYAQSATCPLRCATTDDGCTEGRAECGAAPVPASQNERSP